jgi:hypothetical protein
MIPRGSIGWRMGVGEQYLDDFRAWWSRTPRTIRLALRADHPEPDDWSGFWKSLSS